ncbi:hypothetical protein [Plantactinospora sp. GCM10030261]|uniref:hypothetical protein n=1 Tax=Plantactinospora sp. GCM10030261 TaxID=3273420 RepID=UPI00360D6BD2
MSNPDPDEGPGIDLPSAAPTLHLARRLAHELADVASVEINKMDRGLSVTITPNNAQARSFGWVDFPEEVILHVGEVGGRWELGSGPDDMTFLAAVARSVVAGHVREVFARGRSVVSVMLADGSIETETGYEGLVGCLPLPFWRRWSKSIQYAPYR